MNISQEKKGRTVSLLKWKAGTVSAVYKYYLNRWDQFLGIPSCVMAQVWAWTLKVCCIYLIVLISVFQSASSRNGDCRTLQGSAAGCLGADPTSVSEQLPKPAVWVVSRQTHQQKKIQIELFSSWKCFLNLESSNLCLKIESKADWFWAHNFTNIWMRFETSRHYMYTLSSIWAIKLIF